MSKGRAAVKQAPPLFLATIPSLTTINSPSYNHPMITVSKEDYLKSILEAEAEGEEVISARLADLLKVSPPAVTMALRRLKKDGLVRVELSNKTRAGKSIGNLSAQDGERIRRQVVE